MVFLKSSRSIKIRGAYQNNLKHIDIDIPHEKILVFTGASGSGKSSLVFDTVLAESQRRFFSTLSNHMKQFLPNQKKPQVRSITGLSPAIGMPQQETRISKKATVGSFLAINELLGLLFVKHGITYCPKHQLPTQPRMIEEIIHSLLEEYHHQAIAICALVAESKKGNFESSMHRFLEKGYFQVVIDQKLHSLKDLPSLQREIRHTIYLVIDMMVINSQNISRIKRSLSCCIKEGGGYGVFVPVLSSEQINWSQASRFNTNRGCPKCQYSWPKLDPHWFSPNSLGGCPICKGLGFIADDDDLTKECSQCEATGIAYEYHSIRYAGLNIYEWHKQSINKNMILIEKNLETTDKATKQVLKEIYFRLKQAVNMRLDYLHLARRLSSLSGGELQRLKLSQILRENLRGVLYILDEPSQGLHPLEIEQLWLALTKLKDLGNSILLVDHDEQIIRKADWIVDLGPCGGTSGGYIQAVFSPKEAKQFSQISRTAELLSMQQFSINKEKTFLEPSLISFSKVRFRNLNLPKVSIRKSANNVIVGVSGSGKSTFMYEILFRNFLQKRDHLPWIHCQTCQGLSDIESVHIINREPLIKTSVSMLITQLGVFTYIRTLYARLPTAQIAGFTARDFSLAVSGGRCENCKGKGNILLKIPFLDVAFVTCEHCQGRRYQDSILQIHHRNLSIEDILHLSIEEAYVHFQHHKKICHSLKSAIEIGLGYLKLGQSLLTLSGGENQRLKLVKFFKNSSYNSRSILLLDEPTRGLYYEDVKSLMKFLKQITTQGTTVVFIEHHAAMIKFADWVLEFGPGSADKGGQLIYCGKQEGLLNCSHSIMASYL